MEDFEKRVLKEKDALQIKTEKLLLFLDTSTFEDLEEIQKNLLAAQLTAMLTYGTILEVRLGLAT